MLGFFKSPEEKDIEARIEFNQTKKGFEKYYQDLDVTIKKFMQMGVEAQKGGNRQNAISCMNFVLKLRDTQVKVQGLLQRFEMMNAMQRLSGVMARFMKACGKMGFSIDKTLNLSNMMSDRVAMEKGIAKMDAMLSQMDDVFDSIDQGMQFSNTNTQAVEENPAAAALLDQMMGVENTMNAPVSQAQEPAAASQEPANRQADSGDDIDEQLRRMMEALNS